jgi:hypothetical protein
MRVPALFRNHSGETASAPTRTASAEASACPIAASLYAVTAIPAVASREPRRQPPSFERRAALAAEHADVPARGDRFEQQRHGAAEREGDDTQRPFDAAQGKPRVIQKERASHADDRILRACGTQRERLQPRRAVGAQHFQRGVPDRRHRRLRAAEGARHRQERHPGRSGVAQDRDDFFEDFRRS